jgi:hypothetical protein
MAGSRYGQLQGDGWMAVLTRTQRTQLRQWIDQGFARAGVAVPQA